MRFETSQTIEASPGEVWRHLSEPALMRRWLPDGAAMSTADEAALTAGSRLSDGSGTDGSTTLVVAVDPGRQLTLQEDRGAWLATRRYRLLPRQGATLVTLQAGFTARSARGVRGMLAALLAPLRRSFLRRAEADRLHGLRLAVERPGSA